MGTLFVLLWKDLTIAKRRKLIVLVRMTFPLLIMVLVLYIRYMTDLSAERKKDKLLNDKTTAAAPRCLLYTPNSILAGTLMDEVGRQLGLSRLTAMPHKSPCRGYYPYSNYSEIAELVETFYGHEAVIIFKDMDAGSWSLRQQDSLTYTIQMYNKFNMSSFSSTDVILPPDHPHGDIFKEYQLQSAIQWAINISYNNIRTGQNDSQKLFAHEFPHFRNNVDKAISLDNILSIIYTYIMVISGFDLFTHIMIRMLCERAAGIQELIKMNGVSPTIMGIAYFISSTPPAVSFSVGISLSMQIGNKPVIKYTSGIYTFVGLALYAVSLIAFGMACSYVVNKPEFSTVIALFIYIATIVVIKFVMQHNSKNWLLIMLSGMVVHVPLLWIFNEMFIFDALKKPLTISDLNSKMNGKGSVLEAYICLILQSSMYFAVTWYLSHVRQGKYGNSLPWNFPCKKKLDESAIIDAYREVSTEERDSRYFEEPPEGTQVGIKIINVSKYYSKPALRDVYLDVYKGEITVLLGHNGAGKTTLMSIITGMISASHGKVLVNGLETASHTLQVRRLIGHCPQHNLFIDYINVIEHVMFVNMLKGKSKDHRATSIEILNKLGIGDKAFNDPTELSGGMKRRLQLACALAGGSDVLVLDEPTSGLDVETRRELWNLLLSLRGERTVLLSTHYMEEADALGDRIAALHTGHLRCHATPMFLKKAMGGGYHLSLVTSGKPNQEEINAVVTKHVGGATVRDETMNTITYNMPSAATPKFPALFTELETNRSALKIDSIGVGVSTMEDVFLFLCSDAEIFIKDDTDICHQVPASEYGKIKGKELHKRQAIVLIKRQLNFLKESFITFSILHIVVPGLIIFIIATNNNADSEKSPQPDALKNLDKALRDRKVLSTIVYRQAGLVAFNIFHKVIAFLLPGKRVIANYNHPWIQTTQDMTMPPPSGAKSTVYCVFWAVLVSCVIVSTNSNLQALPLREGESGMRHLHVMAGCPAALYWLCTLAFHTAFTLLTVVPITIICTYVGDTDDTFTDIPFLLTLTLILMLGNIAFCGLMYLLVISFKKTGFSALVVVIIVWSACVSTLKMFADISEAEISLGAQVAVDLSNALPPFSMMFGLAQAAYVARLNALCELHKNRCPTMLLGDKGFDEEKCCADRGGSKEYISFDEFAPGAQVLILSVQGIVYMTLVILVQMGYVNCCCDRLFNIMFKGKPLTHVDELVAAEATYVDDEIQLRKLANSWEQQIVNHNNAMLVSHLHKRYVGFCKKHHAVKGISFSVQKGECFGLLGLNGSGKSTTFKMMTSEICPTSGRIFANGGFLHKQKTEFLHKIGYCPQYLGIDDFLTGRDNLKTLLTIRGLDDKDIDKELKAWITVVGLQKYANVRASKYSGGYKRRLAAAAALCSDAPLSLLDEPTAGVDVGARRLVHAALRKALRKGDSIVITSHSMNEMEALCARIAILEAGKIRALGTSAELRTKYAQGYALKLKVKPSNDGYTGSTSAVGKLKRAVAGLFDCVLKDENKTMLHYHIKGKMNYSCIFTNLEDLRKLFPDVIEDYSVSETTLEEVFLFLAKEHLLEYQASEEILMREHVDSLVRSRKRISK